MVPPVYMTKTFLFSDPVDSFHGIELKLENLELVEPTKRIITLPVKHCFFKILVVANIGLMDFI